MRDRPRQSALAPVRRLARLFAIATVIAALGACANGFPSLRITYQYDTAALAIKATAGTTLGLGVQDRRTYVVSKQKPATFVGASRSESDAYVGTYGHKYGADTAFDVNTASGRSFADDVTKTIQTALSSKGVKVTAVSLPLGVEETQAILLLANSAGKSVLIILNEWRTDTYLDTTLTYDIQAMVIGTGGKIISDKRIAGIDFLGGNAANPVAYSRNVVPIAFRRKLEELFASAEISTHM